VEKAEILGQRSSLLSMDSVLTGLLSVPQAAASSGGASASGRPAWIDNPLEYGRNAYEKGAGGVSPWYYAVGMSTKNAAEQRARTRARENVQADVAAVIASDFKARIDITESALFTDMDIENAERLVETAITNSIKTRIPPFEALSWYVDNGKEASGQLWYIAYVLVRFPRKDIIGVVEKIEPEKVVENVIRQTRIPFVDAGAKDEFVTDVSEAREFVVETITKGTSGN
jgi:hypothetical protein